MYALYFFMAFAAVIMVAVALMRDFSTKIPSDDDRAFSLVLSSVLGGFLLVATICTWFETYIERQEATAHVLEIADQRERFRNELQDCKAFLNEQNAQNARGSR